jgi:hypothetical protein
VKPHDRHVAVRVDDDMLAEVDALIPTLSTSWHRATRSDALRLLVIEGLAALRRKRSKPAGAPPRGKGSRRRAG